MEVLQDRLTRQAEVVGQALLVATLLELQLGAAETVRHLQ
jgi:hypothetical protein